MKFSPIASITLVLLTLMITSCSRGPVFTSEKSLTLQTWNRFDKIIFTMPVKDENSSYDFDLTITSTDDFPFEEMPVYVILTTSSGEERMREVTLKIKEGHFLGVAEGNMWKVTTSLWKGVKMTEKGKCTLSVENMNPKFETPGVDRIGLVVNKTE